MNYHSPSIWHITCLSPVLLITLWILKSVCLVLCNSFTECFNNFFTVEITNNVCQWYDVICFLDHKDFLRRNWNVTLCEDILVFCYSYRVINFAFRIFAIMLNTIFHICAWLKITRFRVFLGFFLICFAVFINYFISFSKAHIFCYRVICLKKFFFNVLINLWATIDFPSLCVAYISIILSCNHDFPDRLYN